VVLGTTATATGEGEGGEVGLLMTYYYQGTVVIPWMRPFI